MDNPIYAGADYTYLTDQGVIVPDTADIRAGIEAQFLELFGPTLNLSPSSPQGLLITALTIQRAAQLRGNADLANQINPNLAGGGFLDAICELTGLQRTDATPSTITGVILTGVPGAIIPAGSLAKTAAGDLFQTVTAVQINIGGGATVDFQSVASGPIPADIGALDTIVTAVIGWETVTNPSAAVLGTETQSDSSLRVLRKQTLAKQGVATPMAVKSALGLLPGFKSLQFRENVADTTQVIDGITMISHSIWVCVQGAEDQDIANALLASKSAGSAWNGTTIVNAVDPASGQEYVVKFDRPTLVDLWVRATVVQIAAITNTTTAVTDAILNWANNGVNGIPGALVGQSISPFEISAAIAEQVTGIYVRMLEISADEGATWQTTEYPIAINEAASVTSGRINVIIAT